MQTPAYLYHATPKDRLDGILAHGLDPAHSKSSLPAVFLASDYDVASNYILMHCDRYEDGAVLQIDVSHLDLTSFGPDNVELIDVLRDMDAEDLADFGLWEGVTWNQVDWQMSLVLCGQAAYHGMVPPTAITVVEPPALSDACGAITASM